MFFILPLSVLLLCNNIPSYTEQINGCCGFLLGNGLFQKAMATCRSGVSNKISVRCYTISNLKRKETWFRFSSCSHRASVASKTLFIFPSDAHNYKIIEMLKAFKNYNTCSDMFRFTQEPSSGSSPVLS